MKQILKHQNLPWLTVFCGGIGLLLRTWLLSTADENGFILRGHISELLLTAFSILVIGILFLSTRSLLQGTKYQYNFPASVAGGIGAAIAAVGIAVTSIVRLPAASGTLALCCWIGGIPAALALLFVAHSRWKGLHPSMIFHTYLCGWLVLFLVFQYRAWSSDPQLEDYCYQLLALVFAMLSAYHRATFDANFGKRMPHAFFSLACVYCCIVSLAGSDSIILYLCLGLWQFTDLCRLTPMPRHYRQSENETA